MKIKLTSPTDPHTTVIDTEHDVTIDESFVGPILTNGDTCLAVFARDDGFEMNVWRGDPEHSTPLPSDSWSLSVSPRRVTVLRSPDGYPELSATETGAETRAET